MEASPGGAVVPVVGPGLLQRSHTVGPGELKRSSSNSGNAFQRSPSYHQHQSQSRRGGGGGGGGGGKPTLEIYRPPNVRVDGAYMNGDGGGSVSNRLNVHAKEFTMYSAEQIKMSKSSGNILALNHHNNNNNNSMNNNNKAAKSALLQQSKSSGNIMHTLQQHRHHQHQLQQSASIGSSLQQSHRVHFRFDVDANHAEANAVAAARGMHVVPLDSYATGHPPGHPPGHAAAKGKHRDYPLAEDHHMGKPLRSKTQAAIATAPPGPLAGSGGIKRSKSLGSADVLSGGAKDLPDFANFPAEVQAAIHRAVEDPNQVSARTLMQLVRHIMDRVVESRSFAEPAAKLCITIIEKEKNETFLESLLNTCQLWYQNREKYLKASSGSPSMRYPAFMAFLNEMYCQLKRRQLQLKTQYDGVAPGLLILTLLAKCCQECLKPPSINSLKEMECLFFVLSSIGKDLETELPARMSSVLAGVRDAFLTSASIPAIRKTLLQLIELHAAQWQLPAPAIMYYYPATNK